MMQEIFCNKIVGIIRPPQLKPGDDHISHNLARGVLSPEAV
jgi:hypothetical protein